MAERRGLDYGNSREDYGDNERSQDWRDREFNGTSFKSLVEMRSETGGQFCDSGKASDYLDDAGRYIDGTLGDGHLGMKYREAREILVDYQVGVEALDRLVERRNRSEVGGEQRYGVGSVEIQPGERVAEFVSLDQLADRFEALVEGPASERRDGRDLLKDAGGFTLEGGDDFLGLDLKGLDASGAEFVGMDLGRTDLSGSKLVDACFGESRLEGADLSGAELQGLDCRDVSFRKGSFAGSELRFACFRDVDLTGADLRGSNLDGVECCGVNFAGADFRGARLVEAELWNSDLTGARLDGAFLEGVQFVDGTKAEGVSFAGVRAEDIDFMDVDLRGCCFRDAVILDGNMQFTDLRGADFSGAMLVRVVLDGAKLEGVSFRGADLRQVKFGDADLTGVDFTDAKMPLEDTKGFIWGRTEIHRVADVGVAEGEGWRSVEFNGVAFQLIVDVRGQGDFVDLDQVGRYGEMVGRYIGPDHGERYLSVNYQAVEAVLAEFEVAREWIRGFERQTGIDAHSERSGGYERLGGLAERLEGLLTPVDFRERPMFFDHDSPSAIEPILDDVAYAWEESGLNDSWMFNNASADHLDLRYLDLETSRFDGTGIRYANLFGSKLTGSWFGEADASYAKMDHLDLQQVVSEGSVFDHADLRGSDLRDSRFSGGRFVSADLSGTNLEHVRCDGVNFTGANMSGCWLDRSCFEGCALGDVQLDGAVVFNSSFAGSSLENVSVLEGKLRNCDFEDCTLRDGDFRGAVMFGCNLEKTDLRGADFSGATLVECKLGAAQLEGADFSGADLRYTELGVVDLTGAKLNGAKMSAGYEQLAEV